MSSFPIPLQAIFAQKSHLAGSIRCMMAIPSFLAYEHVHHQTYEWAWPKKHRLLDHRNKVAGSS